MILVKPYPHPDDWQKEDPSVSLQEMAYPKDKVWQLLTRYEDTTFTHLLKLFYFRDFPEYFNNWSIAVYKSAFFVHKIKKAHGKDKWPDAEDIYDWLWKSPWEDMFDTMHSGILKDFNDKSDPEYQNLPYVHSGGDEEGAREFMKNYYIWLARQLSKNGKVTKDDVQDKIKELLRKHPL
jgi:hypothetical protein